MKTETNKLLHKALCDISDLFNDIPITEEDFEYLELILINLVNAVESIK